VGRSKSWGERDKKTISRRVSDYSISATLMVCGSARGELMPPLFIFPGVYQLPGLLKDAPEGSMQTVQESGWMTQEIFYEWIQKFIAFVAGKRGTEEDENGNMVPRKVLLVTDGHNSRISLKAALLARDNGVIILILPPHTTHAIQPLDKAWFGAWKGFYYIAVDEMNLNARNISKYDLGKLVAIAWEQMTSRVMKQGFISTGICPLDRKAIKLTIDKPKEIESSAQLTTRGKPVLKALIMQNQINMLETKVTHQQLEIRTLKKRIFELEKEKEKEKEKPAKRRKINTKAIILTHPEEIEAMKKVEEAKKIIQTEKEERKLARKIKTEEKIEAKKNKETEKVTTLSQEAEKLQGQQSESERKKIQTLLDG